VSTPGDPWGQNPYQNPYQQPGQPPPPPPGYGPPGYPPSGPPGYEYGYGYGYGPQPGTNGFSIASLVLGIICAYWIGSILAVIFGHIALSQIERSGQQGRGMAIAGLVLGYVWIAVGIILIIVAVNDPHAFDSDDMFRTLLAAR
jgi:hypothetical protein